MSNYSAFKDAKQRESKQSMLWSTRLHDFIGKHPTEYPSDLVDLLQICGETIDMESVAKYQKFHAFLQHQRKKTDELFGILVDDGWFNKYISDGLTEEEIYQKFVDTCLSWYVVPLYYDVDGLYKLIDLHSFILIKQERIRATCKEIGTKFNALQEHSNILPSTILSSMNELRNSEQIKPLIQAKNELDRFLSDGKRED